MQRMWNLKCKIIPVIIGATRVLTKVLRNNLEAKAEEHSIEAIRKTAILGIHHT